MNTYIIDIETAPQQDLIEMFEANLKPPANYKSEEAIAKWRVGAKVNTRKAMSVDPDYCERLMVGVKKLGEDPKIMTLKEFAEWVTKKDIVTFVSFNGVAFDIPAIIRAGKKKDLTMPYRELSAMTKKFPNKLASFKQIDMMLELGQYGKFKSQDKYMQIYLGIKKKEIDFETCSLEELKEHNIEDLVSLEQLYLKFKDIIN